MPTAEEYRRHAQECLQLAREAKELYAKQTMMELAAEFNKAADEHQLTSARTGNVRFRQQRT